jgi:hypothetical protein
MEKKDYNKTRPFSSCVVHLKGFSLSNVLIMVGISFLVVFFVTL